MATRVVGKLDSWDDADQGGGDFMKLEEGSNKVRVIASPYQFYIHWTEDASGAKRKVHCALDGCPLCQRGERASTRWYVPVLDRKSDDKPVIVEIGPQILKGIVGLSKMEEWGDPKRYDVDIKRNPKNSQPLYEVRAIPHKPLTDEEKTARKEFLTGIDLVKMTLAPTPNEVREKIGLPQEPDAKSVDNNFGGVEDDDDFPFED